MHFLVFKPNSILNRFLDNKENVEEKLFEFVDVNSFGSLRTANVFSLLYLVKIIKKRVVEEDTFTEKRLFRKGEPYFKGQYLHLTRSRGPTITHKISETNSSIHVK